MIVALLLVLIVLTSILSPHNVRRTTMHTAVTSRLLYRNISMLTILATRYWILLVVCKKKVSHSLLMNNYGVSRCPVTFVSPLPFQISLDVTSIFF